MTVLRAEDTPAPHMLEYITREICDMRRDFPEMNALILAIGADMEMQVRCLVEQATGTDTGMMHPDRVIVPESVCAEIQAQLQRERIRISNAVGRNALVQALERAISVQWEQAQKGKQRPSGD